jgi:hypothetical protein
MISDCQESGGHLIELEPELVAALESLGKSVDGGGQFAFVYRHGSAPQVVGP